MLRAELGFEQVHGLQERGAFLGGSEVVLDATVPADRSEFGLTWNQMGMSSMHSTITIHAVFTMS